MLSGQSVVRALALLRARHLLSRRGTDKPHVYKAVKRPLSRPHRLFLMASLSPKLFQPYRLGNIALSHRVVHSPLTRTRANERHELDDLAVEYYSQRARAPGTLLIGEATIIAHKAGGWTKSPGIWTEKQLTAWKKVGYVHSSCGNSVRC